MEEAERLCDWVDRAPPPRGRLSETDRELNSRLGGTKLVAGRKLKAGIRWKGSVPSERNSWCQSLLTSAALRPRKSSASEKRFAPQPPAAEHRARRCARPRHQHRPSWQC